MNRALPSRHFQWVPAVDHASEAALGTLQSAMARYWINSEQYYADIDFTCDNWLSEKGYKWIAEAASGSRCMLEVGCGRANFLKHYGWLQARYTGCDFSAVVMAENRTAYPGARFQVLSDPGSLPFATGEFDMVFSVFVLEHCVFPHRVLDEWTRILVPGGNLVILCPNFLGRGCMPSQRVGFSQGTGRQKLGGGRFWDALVTGFDNRVRLPLKAAACRRRISLRPQFFVNLAPTCVTDTFQPDLDAVYATYEPEIVSWLKGRIVFSDLAADLTRYAREKGLILLSGKKQ